MPETKIRNIPDATMATLTAAAKARGMPRETYLRDLLQAAANSAARSATEKAAVGNWPTDPGARHVLAALGCNQPIPWREDIFGSLAGKRVLVDQDDVWACSQHCVDELTRHGIAFDEVDVAVTEMQ